MKCQRRILGIRWFHFVTNASVTSQTGEEGLRNPDLSEATLHFWSLRRLPEATPAHSALRLAVDARTGGKPDIRPEWKRYVGAAGRGRHWAQRQRRLEDRT